ncbi:hypothetical protein METHB2_480012 [Candidatus Methylobacter favarea]|uniref:Transposase DDE domain-containing protein n=1 Tax=Candidatus Methylobacter favarea TaxID=2707345 RepID=A0A8S0WK29_9GAMM|nr:transposase [Candidatus Methylobacter favarea]CAA9891678.1 hypothetical protein METHB2_480012 [Candidatus Methylobacter favarea]
MIGKLFEDRGYSCKELAQLPADQDVQLITTLKKNMKAQSIDAFDKLMRRKCSIIDPQ